MFKRRHLLAVAAATAVMAGAPPGASAQSIWGNGGVVTGVSTSQHIFTVGNTAVRCTNASLAAPSLIGPSPSAPITLAYSGCNAAGLAATVSVSGSWAWNVAGGSFNPLTGVWSGATATTSGAITISIPALPGCVVTIPGGRVMAVNGTNTGSPWSGTTMTFASSTFAWARSPACTFIVPASAPNGTYNGSVGVTNAWDP